MTTDEKSEGKKASAGAELIVPITGMMFAVYYLYSIRKLPWEAQVDGLFIAAVLLVLVLLFLVRTARRLMRGEASLGFAPLVGTGDVFRKRLGLVGLTVLFLIILPWAGFTATIFLFLVISMLLLGVRSPAKLIGVPLFLSLGGYLLFIVALNSALPKGVVERLLGAIF